ncbi:MAG: M13 family metallopeptidase [Enterococcus sp.]
MSELLKTDFYEYVNGAWSKDAVIPADKPATGGFLDLVNELDERLIDEFDTFSKQPELLPTGRMQDAIAFYELALDYDTRNQLGATPIFPLLQQIETLTDLADLNQQLAPWLLAGLPLPFEIEVAQNMKDTHHNALYADTIATILPDKTYYAPEHPQAATLLRVFAETAEKVLSHFGKETTEAQQIVADALAFDKLIVPHVRSSEENADREKKYNPKSLAEFASYSKVFDFKSLLQSLVNDTPEQIIVVQPAYFEALDQFVKPENFTLLKNWMIVQATLKNTHLLSEELRQLGGTYSRFLSGTTEAMPPKKAAFYLANGQFSQVVGQFYGKKYFGEQAKQDVQQMVESMVAVYQERLEKNTWLSETTRQKAIKKLEKLGIHVGYPEQIPTLYDKFITKTKAQGGSLVENVQRFARLAREENFAEYHQEADRTRWDMSAATVNAYFHPFKNVIVFPAAILQAPFYSLEQSKSANYGGIGAVIAHEISHAFDNNGSKFDEFGNLNNWWTEADFAHFDTLAQSMITLFDGMEFAGGKVNGTLTVGENIADAGGLSCALEAAKKDADVSLEDFFINWAKIWRMKAREQYQQLLLTIDTHGPSKLRGNIPVQFFDEFYETFGIVEGDGMYLAPEKRVHIW